MKEKPPSKYTLLIPVGCLIFFSLFWFGAKDVAENGEENTVLLTGSEVRGKSSYFTFTFEGRTLGIRSSKRYRVGDEVHVIIHKGQALEGKKSDSILMLAIRDVSVIYFWLMIIFGIVLPLSRWLSYLPDKAFDWIPNRRKSLKTKRG
ncbi:hypothetical protein QEH56_10880 [Pelagicoccus enzymogenes]|uniref:hypothetical protein n=1 Tax=Pelagicoccus enzymogenes TaxID=2773457 RepID=UPI00280EB3B5|nr:hypothetical protein [Pelagicoccus enzymogenes]MDQ8198657.1 hypothetical protein [Pelagicoccus enzymogenes]